ncbi:MAG TPA: cytochrome c biogenesis protein CcsA [Cytophagales bacterium]|nr:cytochrome c biogenesis protein CcsA [Cytophagales bacterium]
MLHLGIGNAGHMFLIISFVTALLASIAYFSAASNESLENSGWKKLGRSLFYLHGVAVIGVVFCLFYIIYNHYFEYQYAWSHSSRELPIYYMISCFWEGQEGSFLLWIFWNAVLGIILINTNKFWEGPIMTIFALVQAFLTSMILGVVLGDLKIGSSPFILMREANLDAPIFLANPNFIPENGKGLNPLLQNYWMVIHPPTLFLGFATTLISFAYCIAGLWKKKFKEWVRPALPWSLFSALVLGLGILMGGYWAYETLTFGGYWNWDPVENGVFVPWLIQIASIHTLIIFRKNNKALRASILLVIATFLLVLYATFLTRSGVLGDASVHSFTDLGLSGQLLIYLFFFIFLSVFFVAKTWKEIPDQDEDVSVYSREFWIFIGAIVLCLSSFQILIPTSFPVVNKVVGFFGGVSKLAPPADQVAFYNNWQIWTAVLIALLSGTGQFFWWKKMDKDQLKNSLILPIIATLVISALIIVLSAINNFEYIILLTAGVYSIIANSIIMVNVLKNSPSLSGGSMAHIGIGMMLIGILYSSGYSKTISKNNSGFLYNEEFDEETNRDHVLLWVNKPQKMKDYNLTYKGQFVEAENYPGFIKKTFLEETGSLGKFLAKKDIFYEDKKYFSQGDTVKIHPENTYFGVDYKQPNGKVFSLYPRNQVNEQMGGNTPSPDIKRTLTKDLYTHVSAIAPTSDEIEWGEMEEFKVQKADTFFINDYVAEIINVEKVDEIPGIVLGPEDAAVKIRIKILDFNQEYIAEPLFIIKNGVVGRIPEVVTDLGLKITVLNITPETDTFQLGVHAVQKDWIIMKAMEKPLINVLWLGTLVMVFGFCVAIYRRYNEFRKMRDKGIE